jgi:hypothetical protein
MARAMVPRGRYLRFCWTGPVGAGRPTESRIAGSLKVVRFEVFTAVTMKNGIF